MVDHFYPLLANRLSTISRYLTARENKGEIKMKKFRPTPTPIGFGEEVVAYFPTSFGRWETSDGVALKKLKSGVMVALHCHFNPRLETHRASFQFRGQASIQTLEAAIEKASYLSIDGIGPVKCSDGTLEL